VAVVAVCEGSDGFGDESVYLLEGRTLTLLGSLPKRSGGASSVAAYRDGNEVVVVVGCRHGVFMCRENATFELEGPETQPWDIQIALDEGRGVLYAVGWKNIGLCRWDLRSLRLEIIEIPSGDDTDFSKVSHQAGSHERLALAQRYNRQPLYIYDAGQWHRIECEDAVQALVWSASGDLFVASRSWIRVCRGGELLREFAPPTWTAGGIERLFFLSENELVAVSRNALAKWDLGEHRLPNVLRFPSEGDRTCTIGSRVMGCDETGLVREAEWGATPQSDPVCSGHVKALAWTADGSTLAVSGSMWSGSPVFVTLFERYEATFRRRQIGPIKGEHTVQSVAFNADGSLLAIVGIRWISVWSVGEGAECWSYEVENQQLPGEILAAGLEGFEVCLFRRNAPDEAWVADRPLNFSWAGARMAQPAGWRALRVTTPEQRGHIVDAGLDGDFSAPFPVMNRWFKAASSDTGLVALGASGGDVYIVSVNVPAQEA